MKRNAIKAIGTALVLLGVGYGTSFAGPGPIGPPETPHTPAPKVVERRDDRAPQAGMRSQPVSEISHMRRGGEPPRRNPYERTNPAFYRQ